VGIRARKCSSSHPSPASLRQNPNDPEAHTTTIFSEFSLAGKTAVVTGGNGGLGEFLRARAQALGYEQLADSLLRAGLECVSLSSAVARTEH
jgi:hypothetical protein